MISIHMNFILYTRNPACLCLLIVTTNTLLVGVKQVLKYLKWKKFSFEVLVPMNRSPTRTEINSFRYVRRISTSYFELTVSHDARA